MFYHPKRPEENRRHPCEGRDPISCYFSSEEIKNGMPAFAGMTLFAAGFIVIIFLLLNFSAFAQTVMPASATSPSLFFSGEELERIEKENHKAPAPIPAPTRDVITLGAVLYYGPESWTVWLQGERCTPATSRPDLQIIEVKPDHVLLTFTPSEGGLKRKFALKPHQIYHLASGQITENE